MCRVLNSVYFTFHFIIFKYTVFTAVYPFFYPYRTVRLTGGCNCKVPVKYTAVTVIRYGEQPYVLHPRYGCTIRESILVDDCTTLQRHMASLQGTPCQRWGRPVL